MMTGADFPNVLAATGAPPHPACGGPRTALPPSPALPRESGYVDHHHHGGYGNSGPPLCTNCAQPIFDQFILQVQGHTWHSRCLRCCTCNSPLSHTCYCCNSQLYCQDDFFRLFGAQCSSCRGVIPPSDVVRRAHDKVYHLDCFRCTGCGHELRTGDEFYLSTDGQLLCKADFLSIKAKEEGQDENENPEESTSKTKEEKSKILKEYYLQNSKPQRDLIERIAVEVGNEPSTVRSWFRKQRARDKNKESNGDVATEDQRVAATNRVIAPPGGYPLPIVNKARSTGRFPNPANHHVNLTPILRNLAPWTAWDELWSNDFVPPNIDLQPDHLKNGEVIQFTSLPSVASAPQTNDVLPGPHPQFSDQCPSQQHSHPPHHRQDQLQQQHHHHHHHNF